MMIVDDMTDRADQRWSYVADTVMGGVSNGNIRFAQGDGDDAYVRLSGVVSTQNNGGFIQVRRALPGGLPASSVGLNVRVRGNGETYFVFLRSRFGTRPWHSYRASFKATGEWNDIQLPLRGFQPSREELPERINPEDVSGIGIVAYGADFEADVSVSAISVY